MWRHRSLVCRVGTASASELLVVPVSELQGVDRQLPRRHEDLNIRGQGEAVLEGLRQP